MGSFRGERFDVENRRTVDEIEIRNRQRRSRHVIEADDRDADGIGPCRPGRGEDAFLARRTTRVDPEPNVVSKVEMRDELHVRELVEPVKTRFVSILDNDASARVDRIGGRPWDVCGVGEWRFHEADRIDLDVWYVRHRSLWLDLQIVLRTPIVLLRGVGVNGPDGKNPSFSSSSASHA